MIFNNIYKHHKHCNINNNNNCVNCPWNGFFINYKQSNRHMIPKKRKSDINRNCRSNFGTFGSSSPNSSWFFRIIIYKYITALPLGFCFQFQFNVEYNKPNIRKNKVQQAVFSLASENYRYRYCPIPSLVQQSKRHCHWRCRGSTMRL